MKNPLRMTFVLLAAVALAGCQKNADKLGTTVRGRSAPSITAATATSAGSPQTSVSFDSSNVTVD